MGGGRYASPSNFLAFPYSVQDASTYTSQTGRALGVRAEYMLGPLSNGYPNAPWSVPPVSPTIANQQWNYQTMLTTGYTAGKPYNMSYQASTQNITPQFLGANYSATCSSDGYTKAIAPEFCRGTNEPFLSSTIPQV